MNDPRFAATHPVNLIPKELMSLGTGKFEAKLTGNERCQILALRMAGMSIGAIAVTFKVNRRTVTHIFNERSPRYHSVRKMRDDMGNDNFITRFVTQELLDRVRAAALLPEAQMSGEKYHEDKSAPKSGTPNARATRHSGVTIHASPLLKYSHRIEVGWVENMEGYPDGWYSKLLDVSGVDAEEWFGDPDSNTHLTSATALAYARQYCNDNYGNTIAE